MKINTKSDKGIWFDYPEDEEVKFLIRPYPMSQLNLELSEVEAGLNELQYCLVDWKGMYDEEGKPLECNKDNKTYIFDYYLKVRAFVKEKITELMFDIEKQLKN